jgi:HlyD family secretion protein
MGMQSSGLASNPTGNAGRGGLARVGGYVILMVIIVALAIGTYFRLKPIDHPIARSTTVPATTGSILGKVSSTGQVSAHTYVNLSYVSSGRVENVNVKLGDTVKKGDVLGNLEKKPFEIALAQQQANLAGAKARLAAIQAGPRQEDVDVAQALLGAAQAKLAGMLAQGRPEDVKAAEATLAASSAKLHELQQGSLNADVVAAKTAVDQAQALVTQRQSDLAKLNRPADPIDLQNAQLAVDAAKTNLWTQQTTRDGICGQGAGYRCDAANSAIATAQTAVQQAQLRLDQLKQGPKAEEVTSATAAVASAEAQLSSSQAKLAQLRSGALPDDVAQAAAAVDQAQQNLAARKTPFTDADITQQRLVVAQMTSQLALKKAPYQQTDVDQANAAVDQATAQVAMAQLTLDNATISSPIDGVVGTIGAYPGELATSLPPVTEFQVVDPNDLRLDLDIDESDISHVQVGQDVNVAFDALPGRPFAGKVLSVAPSASVLSGVTTYQVKVSIPNPDGVKPGMTGRADIIYARRDNVLLVPNRAVRIDGDKRVVGILQGDKVVPQTVTLGVSDDRSTEVLSGLKVGDLIAVPSTSTLVPAAFVAPKQ